MEYWNYIINRAPNHKEAYEYLVSYYRNIERDESKAKEYIKRWESVMKK